MLGNEIWISASPGGVLKDKLSTAGPRILKQCCTTIRGELVKRVGHEQTSLQSVRRVQSALSGLPRPPHYRPEA